MFGINKEPARATFTPFPDESSALRRPQFPWVQSLDGSWKFHWVKQPDRVRSTSTSPNSM